LEVKIELAKHFGESLFQAPTRSSDYGNDFLSQSSIVAVAVTVVVIDSVAAQMVGSQN
jgi:hypothetical protein